MQNSKRPEEEIRSPGIRITGDCEPLCGIENLTHVLFRVEIVSTMSYESVLITTESSLHPIEVGEGKF